jgi:DNA-binding transcriptional ArsR family regulator
VTTYEALLDALGEPTRRAIVDTLRSGPRAVGDLAKDLPVSRPAVSQHLRVLHQAGLVTYEPAGTRNVYRLRPQGAAPLREWLEEFWQEPLERFREHVVAAGTTTSTSTSTSTSTEEDRP